MKNITAIIGSPIKEKESSSLEKKRIEEGFGLSLGISSYYEKDFAHRLERLRRKIQREKEKI